MSRRAARRQREPIYFIGHLTDVVEFPWPVTHSIEEGRKIYLLADWIEARST
jgi:hypothetical protein